MAGDTPRTLRRLLLVLLTAACAGREAGEVVVDSDGLREICGVAPDQYAPASDDGETVAVPVSEACAAALGRSVSMQWATFAEQPHAFEVATTAGERVISGLFTLLLSGSGSAAELCGADYTPAWVRERSDCASADDEVGSAGRLWWSLVQASFEMVVYAGPGAPFLMSMSDNAMSLGQVTVDDHAVAPVTVAASMVHEAGHRDGANAHTWCSDNWFDSERACDVDGSGAYGGQAVWLHEWSLEHWSDASARNALNVYLDLRDACNRILEPGDFAPCLRVDW
jgi:hypothetical protein